MALKGRAGHTYSQVPHPMHIALFTAGTMGDSSLSGSLGTIMMAPAGQWRAQLPQVTPSDRITQLALIQTAWPSTVEDFSLMAPAGHTVEHSTHSGRQAPRSKLSSGCISLSGSVEGRNTPLGHLATHNWQAVQCWAKWLALTDPGGVIGVDRLAGTVATGHAI